MGRTSGWVVLVLVACAVVMMGCEDNKKYSKENFEALEAHNKLLQQDLEEQRVEMDTLKKPPAVVKPKKPAVTRKAAPTIDDIRRSLPPGTTVVDRNGQTVILISGSQVNFGSGKAGVSAGGKAVLDRVAGLLKNELASRNVVIEGHTDTDPIKKTRHLYDDNYELGRTRAQNVADYLASRGISRGRIRVASFGPDRPISRTKSENRRVEIVVLAGQMSY